MAIIVNEERKSNPWLILIVWLAVVALVAAAIYYLFVKPVPGDERAVISPELESISRVSKITLDVNAIVTSPVYQSLVKRVNEPDLGVFGRPNPFAPF